MFYAEEGGDINRLVDVIAHYLNFSFSLAVEKKTITLYGNNKKWFTKYLRVIAKISQ